MQFFLKEDFIPLNKLLKLLGLADSWGDAKEIILDWLVKINGQKTDIIRKKLYEGDKVEFDGQVIEILKQHIIE